MLEQNEVLGIEDLKVLKILKNSIKKQTSTQLHNKNNKIKNECTHFVQLRPDILELTIKSLVAKQFYVISFTAQNFHVW